MSPSSTATQCKSQVTGLFILSFFFFFFFLPRGLFLFFSFRVSLEPPGVCVKSVGTQLKWVRLSFFLCDLMLSLVGKVVTEERRNGPSERKKKRKKTFYAVLIDLFALCSLDLPFALRVSIVLFFCPRYNILYLSQSRSISYWPCALCFLFSFPPSRDFCTNANLSQFAIIFFSLSAWWSDGSKFVLLSISFAPLLDDMHNDEICMKNWNHLFFFSFFIARVL